MRGETMTFYNERFTDVESAVQFLTANSVDARTANRVVDTHARFSYPDAGVRMHWDGMAWRGELASYVVRRLFEDSSRRIVLKTGQSLAMAQAHCNDPETSSSTCTSSVGKARTRRSGRWFDSYSFEDKWPEEDRKIIRATMLSASYLVDGKPANYEV